MNIKLMIAFLMLPFCGKAQISNVYLDTSYHPSFRLATRPQVNDTVKCIMLVCDTSVRYSKFASEVAFTLPPKILRYDSIPMSVDNSVEWMLGYFYHIDRWHVSYLDENKKPLPKNIIVWMSKNTEP